MNDEAKPNSLESDPKAAAEESRPRPAASNPTLSTRKKLLFVAVLTFGTTLFCLTALELGMRKHKGFAMLTWGLAHPTEEATGRRFFEPNRFKVWNAEWVRRNPKQFEDWPVELQTFEDDDVYPHYLFQPNLRIVRDGNRLRPAEKPEDEVYWSGNHLGLRGGAIAAKKPGTVRVVCLGASTTEGSQTDSDTYPHQLQLRLAEKFGERVEVINAGHHAYNSGDCVAFLKMVIDEIDPDVVLWYQACNDLYWANWLEGKTDARKRSKRRWREVLHRHSALARGLGVDGAREPMPHTFVNTPDNPSLLQWLGNVEAFVTLCREKDVEPVVASFATIVHDELEWSASEHEHVDRWIQHYFPLTVSEIATIYATVNDAGRKLAERHGCKYIDAAAAIPRTHEIFWDGIHYTPEGNKRLANVMAKGLEPVVETHLRR